MANTDKKETQETQEVKANLTQEEARTYAYQIALRFLDGPNYKAFGITEETDATIKRAARDRITPEARIVTPGDPAFNTDIYLAAVTDENAMPAALKEVLTLAQDQAGSDYEKEAVLGTLFYILTALEVEVVTVNALAAPGTLEEKSAEAARRSAEENTKKLNEVIEARAAKLREAFREEHPEFFNSPVYYSILPRQYSMINNALMNELAGATGKKPINAGAYDLPVLTRGSGKRKKDISTYVMAAYPPEDGITSSLTEQERNVSDALMSICLQAEEEGRPAAFTAETLYRVMPGRGERPSEEMAATIEETVEKYRHLDIEVDATEEMRARNLIADNEEFYIKDSFISAKQGTYKANNGRTIKAWVLNSRPPILDYALKTKQIITIQTKNLAIEKVKNGKASGEILSMTDQRRAMTSYMMRRIAVMKHDDETAREALRSYNRRKAKDGTLKEKTIDDFRKQSNIILFESLFKSTGAESDNRETARRNRDFCFDVLDYWKTTGYIKDYSKQTKGRAIRGIIIII